MKLRSGSYMPKPRNKRASATATNARELKIRILKRKRKNRVADSLQLIKELAKDLSPDFTSARERAFYSYEMDTYGALPEFRMPWEVRFELADMWDGLLNFTDVEVPAPPVLPNFQHTEGCQGLGKARGICFSHQDLVGSLMEERAWNRYHEDVNEKERAYAVSKAPSVYSKGYGWTGWKDGGFKVRGSVGVYKRRMAKKGVSA
ncbi:Protein of unknown function [Pyronema omphalodes CBS 100304]|uniref:Uncharacterized protein n=1 Tax=Pyronema omphalodes (strain CBS 100304) TaxID=1076935 RepID=U4KXD5_PYROM|nr:Protein of unknown function [Pyronema omphalodes CBS 100304]